MTCATVLLRLVRAVTTSVMLHGYDRFPPKPEIQIEALPNDAVATSLPLGQAQTTFVPFETFAPFGAPGGWRDPAGASPAQVRGSARW